MEHALTRYRRNAKLSMKEVAKRVGTSRQTIHRIEAGNQNPSWELASKLIAVSGGEVTASDFLPEPATAHGEAA